MRNTSLLSPGVRKKYELEETVAVLNRIYECAREVWRIKKVEEDILQRSTTTRMKEMTFLEKSASKNKSTPGFGGSVGLPLFDFLSVVRRSLEHWLSEDVSTLTNMVGSITPLFPCGLRVLILGKRMLSLGCQNFWSCGEIWSNLAVLVT